ncbi:MAG: CRISPR-associated endonuclease Cas1 [Caldilineaceae bacterium]|nr:CRISPR-associated endonuclease Cas1 [Caldilineaceae bacterium]
MTILHVREPGAVVRRDAERLRVTLKDPTTRHQRELHAIPVRDVEQVMLYGNVQLTTQAAELCLRHQVDVIFAGAMGGYRGRLARDGSRYARLRHAQLRRSDRQQLSLEIAAPLVRAKLAGQRYLLNRLTEQVSRDSAATLHAAATAVGRLQADTARALTLDALRGYEGKGSALYFGALRTLLHADWSFQTRQYHPPPDPFNALLSFGYTLLLKEMETIAQRVGLDPYIGCLHSLEYGRPSLVLDLMEEFRPLVVDYAMLDLALGKTLQPKDFTFTGRGDRPVELGPKLIPLVIRAYENRANDRIRHKPSDAEQRLRTCYELQARIYARTVLGDRARYEGVLA